MEPSTPRPGLLGLALAAGVMEPPRLSPRAARRPPPRCDRHGTPMRRELSRKRGMNDGRHFCALARACCSAPMYSCPRLRLRSNARSTLRLCPLPLRRSLLLLRTRRRAVPVFPLGARPACANATAAGCRRPDRRRRARAQSGARGCSAHPCECGARRLQATTAVPSVAAGAPPPESRQGVLLLCAAQAVAVIPGITTCCTPAVHARRRSGRGAGGVAAPSPCQSRSY